MITHRLGYWLMLLTSGLAALVLMLLPAPAGAWSALPAPNATEPAAPATPTRPPTEPPFDVLADAQVSPDGRWLAVSVVMTPRAGGGYTGGEYYTQLRVVRREAGLAWTVVDAWAPYGLGYTTPQPLRWSRDGRYLYYTHRPVVDGCALFVTGWDLWRVELSTGRVTELASELGLALALAPDERTVAYVREDLRLRELATGAERRIRLEGLASAARREVGNLVWSPDGAQLLLTAAYAACEPDTWVHTLAVVDVKTGALRVVLNQDARQFRAVSWADQEHAWLVDSAGRRWSLEVATGAVTRAR